MLRTTASLRGNLAADLKKFEREVQHRVLISGTAAMARVIYREAEQYAAAHHKTGLLESAVRRRFLEQRSTENKTVYWISWNPKTAPHGHFLEYGTSRAPAYPFIAPAFGHIQEAIAAGRAQMAKKLRQVTSGASTDAGGASE